MVLVHCKRLPPEEHSKDYDEFFYQCPNETNVGVATDEVQRIQNFRVRLKWMCEAAKGLAKDISHQEESSNLLLATATEGERYLSIEAANINRRVSTTEELKKLCDDIRGAAIISFPEKCSGPKAQQELCAVLDSDTAGEQERSIAHRLLACLDDSATNPATVTGTCVMWWAAKCLAREENFTKYVGKMEKTKIIVKLTLEGSNAPPREMALDGKTQSEMMAYWYRKQEEHKKLVEDDDISFANSEWANSQGLKNSLQGMDGGIKFKGF